MSQVYSSARYNAIVGKTGVMVVGIVHLSREGKMRFAFYLKTSILGKDFNWPFFQCDPNEIKVLNIGKYCSAQGSAGSV